MGDKICQATNGDWNTAGNWSPSGVPADNDRAWISEGLQAALLTGIDQGGIDLDLLHIPAGYKHNIGATGNQLKIAADLVRHYGAGELHYACAKNIGDAYVTDVIRFRGAHPGVLAEIDGEAGDAGDITQIIAETGVLKILGNCKFTDSGGLLMTRDGVTGNIANGADTLPDLVMTGGSLTSYNALTNAYILGGTFTREGTGAVALLIVGPGGRCVYNGTGTVTKAIICERGVLDLRQSVQLRTFTTIYAQLHSEIQYDPNLLAYTTFNDYRLETP
jgi:hypothetical protein